MDAMDEGAKSDRAATGPQPSFEELRDAPRLVLLIRTAKLICESGEYLSIVRDISATGVSVRLFHALPPTQKLTLELANGEKHPLERAWERDDQAGFRFATTVDVHAFMEEPSKWPRRPIRLRLHRPTLVIADGTTSTAAVHNFSRYGVLIESGRFLALGQKLQLEVEGLPLLSANVCWRAGQYYGLVLRQTFTFEELARLAAVLQPFDGQPLQLSDRDVRTAASTQGG